MKLAMQSLEREIGRGALACLFRFLHVDEDAAEVC